MKKVNLKMKLTRETLRRMEEADLRLMAGGLILPMESDPVDTCGHACTYATKPSRNC